MYQSATMSSSHSGASTSSGGCARPKRAPHSMRVVAATTPIIAAQTGDLFFAQTGSIHPAGGAKQQRLVAQSGVIVTQAGVRLDAKRRPSAQQMNLHAVLHHHHSHGHQHRHHHHRGNQHVDAPKHGSFFKPAGDPITTFDASHFAFPKSRDALAKKRRPALRRYNSDESHGVFFATATATSSSASGSADNSPMSTNERLTNVALAAAATKPLSKISGSLSSCSASSTTPDTSPESTEMRTRRPEYDAREFLERYSLPRVVRVVGDGRPLLVYKFVDEYVNVLARPIVGKRGREKIDAAVLYFPDAYQGWFSLTNERGDRTAVAYTSLLQLVQEQVYTFLSTTAITAYASKTTDNEPHSPAMKSSFFGGNGATNNNVVVVVNNNNKLASQHKSQYVKCTLHPGQVFKLRAVFQHNDRDDVDNVKSSRSRRERDLANRYAQLIDEKNQEMYVPLTTKGEFYEISSSPRPKLILPGHDEKERPRNPLFVDKDCIYRLGYLLKKCSLPIKVRLLAGPVPEGFQKDFTDLYLFERKVSEPVLLTCPLVDDAPELACLGLDGVRFARTLLGHDTERTLFASARLQAALSYLRANSDAWRKRVRLETEWTSFKRKLRGVHGSTDDRIDATSPTTTTSPSAAVARQHGFVKCCDCPPGECTNNCRNLNEMISSVARHSKAKPDPQPSRPSKWLRHFRLGGASAPEPEPAAPPDPELAPDERRRSLDRYKDMSKLIEERFGVRRKKTSNPVKKSASFMFALKRTDIDGVGGIGGPATQASKSHSSLMQSGATAPVDVEPIATVRVSNPVSRQIHAGSSDAIPEEDVAVHGKPTSPPPPPPPTDIGLDLKICDVDEKFGQRDAKRTYGRSLNDVTTDMGPKINRGYTCSLKDLTATTTTDRLDRTRAGRPDVIPHSDECVGGSVERLDEPRRCENSFITDRLCSEFHVKTKNVVRPGRSIAKRDTFVPPKKEFRRKENRRTATATTAVVTTPTPRADIARLQSRALPVIEDLPYCSAIDALDERKTSRADAENIYAEICEEEDGGGGGGGGNEPRTELEYPYVKLGSNQIDEDAIYNTLR